ncbi:hypothetical protein Lgra_3337 [Legionella gratiana]|uniref:Uncharacterized protein n=1 Tax=Legionella gratiana TaxID=45066 RepID=A0A378JC51_9GAMM|nr:hypothetical protein [Legionella gratiana]KTD06560.1 hypothetical protein Lgra_3337 [Legionella gratiana]STX45382.1 Uncharacterised protein [Legionella gratiana]
MLATINKSKLSDKYARQGKEFIIGDVNERNELDNELMMYNKILDIVNKTLDDLHNSRPVDIVDKMNDLLKDDNKDNKQIYDILYNNMPKEIQDKLPPSPEKSNQMK